MTDIWEDVTEEVLTLSRGRYGLSEELKFLQVVCDEKINLEEMMHSHEVNDQKIDPKHDINHQHTIEYMLKNGQIKLPQELTIRQIYLIYQNILKLEALVLRGYPLPQTIYTFTYLYDPRLYAQHSFISPLVNSINTVGAYIFDLHKQSCSIKEDDLGFSTFSFHKNTKSNDQVLEQLLKAEKEVEEIMKKQTNQNAKKDCKLLSFVIKLRRSIHLLNKSLGKFYESKNQTKIEGEFKGVLRRIGDIEELLVKYSQKQEEKVQGVFSQNIYKTLRSHFGPRDIPIITFSEALNEIKNAICQFELFLPPLQRVNDYRNRLDILSSKSLNLWSKSYIKINLFHKEDFLLSTIRTVDTILNDLNDWCPVREDVKNDQKFTSLINAASVVMSDSLYKLCSRNSRWFWENSKIYDDFNLLIHLSNEIDTKGSNSLKRESFLCPWFYHYGVSMMVRQILIGFQEDLYQSTEYPYVAFFLEYLLHVIQKNSEVFLVKLDKNILDCYFDNSLGKNKKKKKLFVSELQKKFFADCMFKKGLKYYIKAFLYLLLILIQQQKVDDPFAHDLDLRIKNRFRIFKNVLFLKKKNFQEFTKQCEDVKSNEKKYLDEASNLLKEGKLAFSLFTQFENDETFFHQKEDAEILEKACVKLSLVAMTLKFNQKKKFEVIRMANSKYPEIVIS